ncbi:MAG: protein translocase subunit SecD, partial [Gaiellales bacterium]
MRRHLLILLALLAALAGVAVLAFFRQPTLGLDLQGGLEVVLEARPERGRELTQEDLDRSVEIIRDRVDKTGVAEPEIRKQGENQIAVSLAGVHDTGRAARLIGQTAKLEFYDLQGDTIGPSISPQGQVIAAPKLLPLLSSQQTLAKKGTPTAWYLYGSKKERLAGPADTQADILRELPAGKAPEGSKFYAVPEGRIVLTCGTSARLCPGVGVPTQDYYYLFEYQPDNKTDPIPELTGEDLNGSGTRADFDQNNQPIVTLDFTDAGGDKFHEITRELARRGALRANTAGATSDEERDLYNQSFAIVLDGEIRSFPSIDFDRLPDGIAGGNAIIEGLDNLEEAQDLALVLQTGALPVEFVQVERTDISATLGEDSLREAVIAGIGGLIAVAFFLLLFYRFLGVVAIIGLAIYGVFLYGALLLFNVTLTLPGFAGLILTIGVAADANVVIFERIKEEVRAGKSVRAAIAGGYRKGFNTIIDANVVTMITAFVLFAVATSGVKGFALMLLIGTLLSMVTAVAATRALLGLLAGFRWFNNPAFMGATAQKIPAWQRIDFVGRAKFWFALSGAVIVIGIGSLIVQGLNLGIDFKGGSQVTFETPQPTSVEDVRREAAAIGRADAVIQGRGDIENGGYRQFTLKTESLSAGAQNNLQAALQSELSATSIGVKNVSASFSEQILRGAVLAIIVSLALIVIYVSLRFEFKFSLPVLAALLHDILITLGLYSLTGREMTAGTVAAILTILGYSIYDTIIIFDRVRENIPLMRR